MFLAGIEPIDTSLLNAATTYTDALRVHTKSMLDAQTFLDVCSDGIMDIESQDIFDIETLYGTEAPRSNANDAIFTDTLADEFTRLSIFDSDSEDLEENA